MTSPVERVVLAAVALEKNKHSMCDCGADWEDGNQWDNFRAALSALPSSPASEADVIALADWIAKGHPADLEHCSPIVCAQLVLTLDPYLRAPKP